MKKSFDITADPHQPLTASSGARLSTTPRVCTELERFAPHCGVQVMTINIEAFSASGTDARRIYELLDDLQSRKPIDVIASNRPIKIIDEPRKTEGDAKKASTSLEALGRFNALFAPRYSATHNIGRTMVHHVDAVDAYNQKLMKKVAVRGITVKHLAGSVRAALHDRLVIDIRRITWAYELAESTSSTRDDAHSHVRNEQPRGDLP